MPGVGYFIAAATTHAIIFKKDINLYPQLSLSQTWPQSFIAE
jgi:hypothetical protein